MAPPSSLSRACSASRRARGRRCLRGPASRAQRPRPARRRATPGPCATRRRAPQRRGIAGARRGSRPDTGAAFRNPQTPPCARRTRGAAREAACGRGRRCRSSVSPGRGRAAGKPGRAPSVWEPESIARRGGGFTPSVRRRTLRRPLSRVSRAKRSFCLRVSGAVAPSAPASAGLSRKAVRDDTRVGRGGKPGPDSLSLAHDLSGLGSTRFVRSGASMGRCLDDPDDVATGAQDGEVLRCAWALRCEASVGARRGGVAGDERAQLSPLPTPL